MNVKENSGDRSVDVDLSIYTEDVNTPISGYRLKFSSWDEWESFSERLCFMVPFSSLTTQSSHQRKPSLGSTTSGGTIHAKRSDSEPSLHDLPQPVVLEYNRLIIYCQTVKLKELNINRTVDLLGHLFTFNGREKNLSSLSDRNISCREMISLNFVKAAAFCSEQISMILCV